MVLCAYGNGSIVLDLSRTMNHKRLSPAILYTNTNAIFLY